MAGYVAKKPGLLLMIVSVIGLLLIAFAVPVEAASPVGSTWVVNIEGDIDQGLLLFVQKAYAEAVSGGASAIIFRIDTYGGYIDQAIQIKDIIMASKIPTVCYVSNKAISAGALLALAGEKMAMAPGTTIGAAEPRLGNETADEKVVSMWSQQLASVAEARGRNGQIAAAMADSDIVIDGLVEKGKLLTLTDTSALQHGISDATVKYLSDVPAVFNLPSNEIGKTISLNLQDKIVKALSSPYVAAILLMLGLAGLVVEVFTAGFGIAGAIGVISFALYFAANFWAGYAGIGSILIFVAGLILLVVEIFVTPGFGVPGLMGIVAIMGSIAWASPSMTYAVTSLALALVGAIVLIAVSLKFGKTRKAWSRLILSLKQENTGGYVAPSMQLAELAGKIGIAATTLRPSGTAVIENSRIDVVTDGEFIEVNSQLEVLRVEGTRVIVRKLEV